MDVVVIKSIVMTVAFVQVVVGIKIVSFSSCHWFDSIVLFLCLAFFVYESVYLELKYFGFKTGSFL